MSKIEELIAAVLTAHPEDDRMRALAVGAREGLAQAFKSLTDDDIDAYTNIHLKHSAVAYVEARKFARDIAGLVLHRLASHPAQAPVAAQAPKARELAAHDKLHELGFSRDEDWFVRMGWDDECRESVHVDTVAALASLPQEPASQEAERKLAPFEPTPEMLAAGAQHCTLPHRVWRAMHAASPAEPASQEAVPQGAASEAVEEEPTADEVEDFRRRHWMHWNTEDNLLISHLVSRMRLATPSPARAEAARVADPAQSQLMAWALTRSPAEPARVQGAPIVTEAMVTAYLTANDAYWRKVDELPPKPGKWRGGTPSEATRVSLEAALATQPPAAQGAVPPDVLEAAQSFVDNGYRGPLAYARKVFDWVAGHGAGA